MIIKKFFSFAVILALGVIGAHGLEVEVSSPGYLLESVDNPESVTELKVKGAIDASDLYKINFEMRNLVSLDLSAVTIVEYKGNNVMGRSFYPGATIPYGAFLGSAIEKIVLPTQEKIAIDDCAFMSSSLKTLPSFDNVVSIGSGAFGDCNNLKDIVMPAVEMSTSVFADCKGLESVDMGNVTTIPASTFRGCTALKNVKGSKTIEVIGNQAFEGDASLENFEFGPALRVLGVSAFASTGLTSIDMEESNRLNEISDQAFANSQLTAVSLPENMTAVGDGAFFGNSNLNGLELPASIIILGAHSLVSTPLSKIDLPEGLEEIGDYALAGQKEIKDITFPSTLIYIGSHGMESMTGLEHIIGTSLIAVPELGDDVWDGVNQKNVVLSVQKSLGEDFKSAEQWKEFNIDDTTGIDDAIEDVTGERAVRGRFVGTALQIESASGDIDVVRLFDTSGRMLLSSEPHSSFVSIETSDFPGGVFIVKVILEDKTSATLKMGRK